MRMSNKVYDILKFLAQIVLPAIATFWITICGIWELPLGDEVSRTVMAVDTLLGALLMLSNAQYKEDELDAKMNLVQKDEDEEDKEA